ncbi:MAG: hypothetical protein Q9163_004203 [Psora crenata]
MDISNRQTDLSEDRGPSVVAASIILIILPTVAVGLRFASRWISRAGFWWDDHTIIVALILSWGPNILNLHGRSLLLATVCVSNGEAAAHDGLGKHVAAIPRPMFDVLSDSFKLLYAYEFLYAIAKAAVKFSIACVVSIVRLLVLCDLSNNDLTWYYVHPAIWSAAEPSIAVVSASLPSLRPLFARLISARSYPSENMPLYRRRRLGSSSLSSSSSNGEKKATYDGNFNRLQEHDSTGNPWVHNVTVTGGMTGVGRSADYDADTEVHNGTDHFETPTRGIRVKTTVTITETVDWQDELF